MAVPYSPTIKSVTSITSNSAYVIRRDFVGTKPTTWAVQWQNKGSDSASAWSGAPIKSVPADDNFTQLTGLARNSNYLVRARATNSSGNSDWSPSFSFATPAEVPGPPNPYYIDAQGQTGFHYLFNPPTDNGGIPVREYQVGYGTDPNTPQATQNLLSGDAFVWNLQRYTTYYVWSRARNDVGWGPWSARFQIQTHAYVPAPPTPTFIGDQTQTSFRYSFQNSDDGGAPILEWQVGYSTDPNTVQQIFSAPSNVLINGLQPATNYYAWSRGRNVEGWGNWSARSDVRTIAGARVLANGVWKEAIPYVKDGNVWHLARPYTKSIDWKPTI